MNIADCTDRFKDDNTHAVVLTDNKGLITFCNDCWLNLCGYTRDEVMNKTNKFLQGTLTEKSITEQIGRDLRYGLDVDTVVTNYKKNGLPFKNHLSITRLDDGFLAEIRDLGKCDYELDYDNAINKRHGITNHQMIELLV
tara:strand:- start:868 stop:1287 length:420 start_codon:yes stop_codon:yes gene_type:complete